MKLINLLLTISAFLCFNTAKSQGFTKEREKFIKEWQKLVSEPDAVFFCKEVLPKMLKGTSINDGQFTKIVDNCNALQGKEVPVYPELYHYLASSVYQIENKFPSVFNSEWYSILVGLQSKDQEKFTEFMSFSNDLFMYKAFYKEDTYKWFFEKGNMTWNTDKKLTIICQEGNLVCRVYDGKRIADSSIVYKTSGVLDVFAKKWEGKAGVIDWQKVKFNKEETFAIIRGYRCDLKSAQVKADTVELTTPYFKTPILGKLSDKTILELNEGESSPQFVSYEKRLKIPDLRENLDYDGGFTLKGAEFIGNGTEEKPAKIILKRDNKRLIEVASVDFQMDPVKVIARKSSVKMFYANGDSLYIKEAFIFLDENKKELSVTAAKKGYDFVPFEDSYFNLFINAPLFVYKLNSPLAYFTYEIATSQEQKVASIVSRNYFDQAVYQKFKGMGNAHPFSMIANKCESSKKYDFSEGDLATMMNKSITQAKPELVDLAAAGFLTYNSVNKLIHVEKKLINYAKSGTGELDFDNLRVVSDLRPLKLTYSAQEIANDPYLQLMKEDYSRRSTKRERVIAYALIDLDKKTMRVNEVDDVQISIAQKTDLYPDSSYIVFEKDRNIRFAGLLVAGKFEVHSSDMLFDYDKFKVNIPFSDYASFRVKPLRKEDGTEFIPMVSNLSFMKGEVQIDNKDTKSGRSGKNTEFPLLVSVQETKVFYNSKDILKGAYDSTRFYYTVKPFSLDSLDNFSEKAFSLEGELNSGGIFPKITENLKIMNDYSFGFFTQAPLGGFSFYGTENKYENKIVLSSNGLQGSGTINFLNSTSVSNKLTFLPDSTIGVAKFINKEISTGVLYPSVVSESALINYQPRKEMLLASSFREVPLTMFNGETDLTGTVSIDKKGMIGSGSLKFKEAIMKSGLFNFTHDNIKSANTSLSLLNRYAKFGDDPIAIQAESLNADITFKERKGTFNSTGSKAQRFPANLYYCKMDKFVWQMDGESIAFEKNKGGESNFESGADLVNDNFFSLVDTQDSLRFKALSAKYDLKSQTIFCGKVEFVKSGDALLYPDSMKVTIRKAGIMDPFSNAVIVANDVTKYHRFEDANVQITSRKSFNGNAKYLYFDHDSVLTKVQLSNIKSTGKYTIGIGEISEASKFKLSKEFDYFGKINVFSYAQGVFLDGQARLNHSCKYEKSWMTFQDTILAKNIQIPIAENPVNAKGAQLSNGFLWRDTERADSLRIYPSFMSKQEGELDVRLFNSFGYIQFNDKANEFQIASKDRLNKKDSLTNILKLHLGTCSVGGEGDITLGVNLGEMKTDLYGKIEYNQNENKTTILANAKVDFIIAKEIIEGLANKLKIVQEFPELDLKNPKYNMRNTLTHWTNKKTMEDVMRDFDEERLRKMPSSLDNTFILTGIVLESYGSSNVGGRKGEKGLISRESKIGVMGMNGNAVMKEVDMEMFYLQTFSKESGQGFSWNLSLPDERKYFINYTVDKKVGALLFYTKDDIFNKSIMDIKPDKRKSKNFTFDVAEDAIGSALLSKFKGYFLYR
jgi:hypothetical protein